MKKFPSVLFLLTLCAVFSAYGQTKKQDIVRLFDAMDVKAQGMQVLDLILPSLQEMSPGVPAEYWTKFKLGIKMETFVEMFIPIYDKYLSHDDIKNLIKFYESPTGKKFIKVQPLMTQDAYQASEKWGEKLAHDIIAELKQDGYF
jgi:hypothetical protein